VTGSARADGLWHDHVVLDPPATADPEDAPISVAVAGAAALDNLRLGPTPRLPGRGWAVAALLFGLVWLAITGALIILVTWNHAGPELVGGVLLPSALATTLLSAAAPATRRRTLKRLAVAAPQALPIPAQLRPALASHGVSDVEIRIQAGATIHDRCIRLGRRAWVVLAQRTIQHPQQGSFVLAHELGHLVRNDALRNRVAIGMYASLLLTADLSFDSAAWAVAIAGSLVHFVLTRWWSELACDTIAVQWSSVDALHVWAAEQRAMLGHGRNRTLRRRLRRLLGLLTHPPFAVRLRLHPRPH
jgi:Zn-dependent protease with chaperone function